MTKIQTVSIPMRAVCFVGSIMTLIGLATSLLFSLANNKEGYDGFFYVIPAEATLFNKLLIVLPSSLVLFFLALVTFFAYKFFHALSRGEIFTTYNANILKKISGIYLAGDGLYFLSHFMLKADQRLLLGTADVIAPLLILLAAWILEEGGKQSPPLSHLQ